MRTFVNAKHWQLFIVLIASMVAPSSFIIRSPIPFLYEICVTIFMCVFFGWICSVGIACNKLVPAELQKSPLFMLAGLGYAVVYTLVLSMLMASNFKDSNPQGLGYILPFHLAAMASIFYSLAYAAKQLVTLQRGQRVSFFEYSSPFFMFWFFPLGIWFIQPRVNSLVGGKYA